MTVAYFTKAQARTAARKGAATRVLSKSSSQFLKESASAARDTDRFDIFLSHSINDAELVEGVKRLLEDLGFVVYVDWLADGQLDRNTVSPETAALLRKRMKQSSSLIYLATEASSSSKWMPWELGYFDGLRSGMVAVMPLTDNEGDVFRGQEYLGLYPRLSNEERAGTRQREVVVKGSNAWTPLSEFGKGRSAWSAGK